MKKCPMCQAAAADDAAVCFECLYSFELMSCAAMPEMGGGAAVERAAEADGGPVIADGEVLLGGERVRQSEVYVLVKDPELGARSFPLVGGSLHLGRLPTNDIVLNDKTVSRRHLHVFVEQGRVWAEDFGSANPARLNGVELTGRRQFDLGDELVVRGASLRLACSR